MQRLFYLALSLAIVLLALVACGASSVGSSSSSTNSTTVQVTETEYKIESSLTHFTPGVAYHFVVKNNGAIAHEFMIMPRSEGSMDGMSSMASMDKMALAKIENVNPGQTEMLDYTFPVSMANSHPQFACYLPGHYESGMKLDVSVAG